MQVINDQSILNQASTWGFICERDQHNNWQILPKLRTTSWKLQQNGERWLLLVDGVAQVNLHPPEAITFLERRWSSRFERKAV
ncbi:MAG TPA: hypothetical protein V6D30_04385 [Leptolyngbyaceae cyanobacterium]|jgi:hypothetical protein